MSEKIKKSSGLQKQRISGKTPQIAIIRSRFNPEITEALKIGAIRGLTEAGLEEKSIQCFEVPGAFEIPLAAKAAAQSKKFSGIICLGAVIRGDTPHFDYVCRAVTDGILQTQLLGMIPIAFGILTTDTLKQALVRSDKTDQNKGYEAAQVVLEMTALLKTMRRK